MYKRFKENVDPEKVADIILALVRIQSQFSNPRYSEEFKKDLEEYNKELWQKFYEMTEYRE